MKIHTMEQLTPEWFAVRIGKLTATKFPTMANGKPETIETLCLKLAAERITGQSCGDDYTNDAMTNGTDVEPLAREAYETTRFVHVNQVGFLELDEFVGVSPDGLIDEEGGVEIKCPMAHTHLKYLTAGGEAWTAYRWQVQGALWVSGRTWWDFVSFNPAFPPDKQLLIERVLPDEGALAKLTAGADKCRKRIAEIVKAFNG